MKQQVKVYQYIINFGEYEKPTYSYNSFKIKSDGWLLVSEQTVEFDAPDDMQAVIDAHLLEIKSNERMTLEAQKADINAKLEALSNE